MKTTETRGGRGFLASLLYNNFILKRSCEVILLWITNKKKNENEIHQVHVALVTKNQIQNQVFWLNLAAMFWASKSYDFAFLMTKRNHLIP